MSNIIQFSGQLNKNALPYMNQHQLAYAYFEIRPGAAAANIRLPLNFSLILDRSGSMTGEKITQLRQAVKLLIGQLQPNDYLSIVAFNSSTDVLVSATTVHNPGELQRQVDKLKASGGTTLAPAMKAGLNEISKYMGPDKASRLIVLTDGETTGADECRQRADEAGQMGVPVIALGLGSDWNEELLIDLGQRSGPLGSAGLINSAEQINAIFADVLTEMKIVAQNLSFRLLMVQGVEARRIWQVIPLIKDVSFKAIQGRTVTVDLPELSEAGAAYLIEMLIPPRQPGAYRFAQGEVLYDVPAEGAVQRKESINVTAEITTNPHLAQQVNGRIMNIVEKVTAFKLQTQALNEAEAGNLVGATQKLRAAHTILLDQGELELAQNALAEAQRLEQGQGFSNEGRKTVKLQSSKTVKLSDLDIDLP
jgi:Ca-activated chloride channel homolog